MRFRMTPLLILLAGLLTAVGFLLPWVVSGWQDRQAEGQILSYQTKPAALSDLFSHLQLAASGYEQLSLDQGDSSALSPAEAETAARRALAAMAEVGLSFLGQEDLFSPARWTFSSATPFVAVGSVAVSPSVVPQRLFRTNDRGNARDKYVVVENAVAEIFWSCTFTNAQGQELLLVLDDSFQKMLSFHYRRPLPDGGEAFSFSMASAQAMQAFCQEYYAIDPDQFDPPEFLPPASYRFPFVTDQGSTVPLSLQLDADREFLTLTFNFPAL